MKIVKKLPDAEFEIMKTVWQLEPPVTPKMLSESLNNENERKWSLQTIHTLLNRLVERGFLKTRKEGKERLFYAIVGREEYLQFETNSFVKQYHEGSRLSLINTLYPREKLSSEDINELKKWLEEQGGE